MTTETKLPELLTPSEAAEVLRTTTSALAQDRYLGRGAPFIRAGRRILYAREQIAEWLAANTVARD